MQTLEWTTEKRKVSELIPYKGNPRQLTEQQAKDLTKSLEKFNLVEIPAINRDNTIVAGHQRLAIMSLLGRGAEEIDVRVPNRTLTEEELSEYCIRSNKNTGEWDLDALANFDESLLKDIGFDSKELDKIFQLDTAPEDDDVPEARQTDIKLGDIFRLGQHVLLCGDSATEATVAQLMGKDKADLLFTDPPYNVNYYGGNRPQAHARPKDHKLWDKIYSDNLTQEEYEKWLKAVFGNVTQFLEGSASAYIWNGFRQFGPMTQMLIDLGFHISNVITWVKPSICISYSDYNFQLFSAFGAGEYTGPYNCHQNRGQNQFVDCTCILVGLHKILKFLF